MYYAECSKHFVSLHFTNYLIQFYFRIIPILSCNRMSKMFDFSCGDTLNYNSKWAFIVNEFYICLDESRHILN